MKGVHQIFVCYDTTNLKVSMSLGLAWLSFTISRTANIKTIKFICMNSRDYHLHQNKPQQYHHVLLTSNIRTTGPTNAQMIKPLVNDTQQLKNRT